MSGRVVGDAFACRAALSATDRYVLVAYADNADHDGKCWPDKDTIAEKSGVHLATVYRSYAKLVDLGLIREGTDERDRECLWVLSQGAKPDSRSAKPDSQAAKRTNTKEPSEEPSGKEKAVPLAFDVWLEDYREVTGRPARGSRVALRQFAARTREGWTLPELKAATRGCHGDEWCRTNGHDVPETILAASKVNRYVALAAQKSNGHSRKRGWVVNSDGSRV